MKRIYMQCVELGDGATWSDERVNDDDVEFVRRGSVWTCFHCDETFTDERQAREHFGSSEAQVAACRIKAGAEQGLLGALRRAEVDSIRAWDIIHSESGDAVDAMRAMESRHANQLRVMEELGYERGLRDAIRSEREVRLLEALKDAIRRPMGVVPDSALEFIRDIT